MSTQRKTLDGGLGPNAQPLVLPTQLDPATGLASQVQQHASHAREWISVNQAASLAMTIVILLILTLGFTARFATGMWQVSVSAVFVAILVSFSSFGYRMVRDSLLHLNNFQVSVPVGIALVMPVVLGTASWLDSHLFEPCLILYVSYVGVLVATQKVVAVTKETIRKVRRAS